MSKAFYWGVYSSQERKWSRRYHFRFADAKDEAARLNGGYTSKVRPRKWTVRRVLMEHKGDHIDIYEHEFKRLKRQ